MIPKFVFIFQGQAMGMSQTLKHFNTFIKINYVHRFIAFLNEPDCDQCDDNFYVFGDNKKNMNMAGIY